MTIMIISLFFLIYIALCIRRRFIHNSILSSFLRIPLASRISLLIPVLVFSWTHYSLVVNDVFTRSPLSLTVISPIILVVALSSVIAFFMAKGPIKNTYFSMENGDVYVAINKKFIPINASKSEQIELVSEFIRQVISLESIRGRNIILKSHLITRGFCRVITKTLESEGVSFSHTEYSPTLFDRITLNLWYGGETRFCLLSDTKHPNGFKVHKTGHKFIIHKKK